MNGKLLFVLSLKLALCAFLCSCSNDALNDAKKEPKSQLITEFLDSEYGILTLNNHGLTVMDLDIEKSKTEFFKSKGVTAFNIPIVKNKTIIGRLNAFIVPKKDAYRAIVEMWNKTSNRDYDVTVTTGAGAYLATIEVSHDGTKTTQKILDVPLKESAADHKTKRKKAAKESWWECTTRVYSEAKKICNGDRQCDFLCDLVDLGGGCTISMAAAAAIVCL